MTINFRTIAAGAALLLAPAFAQAQESVAYPRDFGTPTYQAPQGSNVLGANVLGGGEARLVGNGEDARVEYTGPVRSQAPIYSHIVGSGEDARIIYSASPDRATALSEAERATRGQRG
ncbi:hypothetical protein [Roseococcus suduntuyensis]|uniref:Uncharacterized protein n=1 Tax=Roseococcus suduntuyensis TaxID=455361 RepID=A0A840AB83_9PROT|nr:hypothetical protein [Roseococcus suduntuyensis]MBB3897524.1 hypothetical protein [Roseococcus suduntuyensis]